MCSKKKPERKKVIMGKETAKKIKEEKARKRAEQKSLKKARRKTPKSFWKKIHKYGKLPEE